MKRRPVPSNPVARAVARDAFERATRDFRLKLFGYAEGENVGGDSLVAADVLATAIRVLESRGLPGAQERVLRGSMSALVQLAERGFRWRCADAVAIEVGLKTATDVLGGASPGEVRAAHAYVQSLAQKCRPPSTDTVDS